MFQGPLEENGAHSIMHPPSYLAAGIGFFPVAYQGLYLNAPLSLPLTTGLKTQDWKKKTQKHNLKLSKARNFSRFLKKCKWYSWGFHIPVKDKNQHQARLHYLKPIGMLSWTDVSPHWLTFCVIIERLWLLKFPNEDHFFSRYDFEEVAQGFPIFAVQCVSHFSDM